MNPTPKADNVQSVPVSVEIVFQGGGAKLAALLAAAGALRQAEIEGKIEITGITGTSAGAIAGCLLAVPPNEGKGFDSIINELWLEGVGLALLDRAKPQWWGKDWATLDYWRNQNLPQLLWTPWRWRGFISKLEELAETARSFWSGKPLWNTEPFEQWLAAKLGATARLDELKPPVRVTRTDLKACVSETVKDGIAWREAMNSAAFPFLLRLWSEGYVDGGICENLPVEAMKNGAIILAFTFPVQDPSEPSSIPKFSGALFNAAIANSVRRAAETLPKEQIHTLNTTLETFDFHRAFSKEFYEPSNKLDESEFQRLKRQTGDFINQFCEHQRRNRELEEEQKKRQTEIVQQKWWLSADRNVDELMKMMSTIYESQHTFPLNHHVVRWEIEATCWKNKGSQCQMRLEFTYSSDDQPVYAVQLSLIDVNQDDLMVKPDVIVLDELQLEVPFAQYPIRDPKDPKRRCLGVFFTPPIAAKKQFTVRFTESPKLEDKDLREMVWRFKRASARPADNVEFILHYPGDRNVSISFDAYMPRGVDLPAHGYSKPSGFKSVGRKWASVILPNDRAFGFRIRDDTKSNRTGG